MAELKPCPFCGGEGKVENKSECYGFGDYATETFVRCKTCGARGTEISDREVYDKAKRKMRACEAWNRRADHENQN